MIEKLWKVSQFSYFVLVKLFYKQNLLPTTFARLSRAPARVSLIGPTMNEQTPQSQLDQLQHPLGVGAATRKNRPPLKLYWAWKKYWNWKSNTWGQTLRKDRERFQRISEEGWSGSLRWLLHLWSYDGNLSYLLNCILRKKQTLSFRKYMLNKLELCCA